MSNIIVHPILGNFKILDEIGEGSFSTVYKCKHDECDVPVAIKVLEEELPLDESDSGSFSSQSTQPHNSNNSSLSDIDKNKIVNAFELEKRFSHPLICEGYDMFTWNNKTCLIHEMVEGETLLDHLNNFAPLEEVAIQTFLGQLVVILNYLHNTVHVIHRDLKCENVIVDIYRNIRLIDFGFACSSDESLHTTICGSPAYIAPEMILNQPYDYSVDIWSLGVIVYAMAFGYLPFDDPNILNNMQSILNDEPEYPNTVSSVLIDLIKRMLEKDPKKRITIEEISQHQFFCEDPFGRNYLFDLCAFETISNEMKKSINKCLKMTPPIPRGTLSSSVPLVNPCTSLGDIGTPVTSLRLGSNSPTSRNWTTIKIVSTTPTKPNIPTLPISQPSNHEDSQLNPTTPLAKSMINKLNQCSALSSPAICSTHLASGNNCESSISTDNIPKFDHLTIPIISEIDENSKIKQNFFMRIMQRQLLCRKMGRYGRSFLRPIAVNHCCHANTFMNNNDDLANMITVRKRRRQTCDIVMTWKGLPKLDMQNQPALAVSRAELPLLKKPRLLYQHIVQC